MERLTERYIPNDEKKGIAGIKVFESKNKIPLVKVLSGEYLYPAIEKLATYEDIDNKIPSYFQGRVVSLRFAQRNWVKIAVKAKWLYEWIDDETGPESDYIEREKNFTIPLSMIGKSVFLTREEAGGVTQ